MDDELDEQKLHEMAQSMITDAEFDEMMLAEFSMVEQFYEKMPDGRLPTMILALEGNQRRVGPKRKGSRVFLQMDEHTWEERQKIFYGLGRKLAVDMQPTELVMFVIIAEAWICKLSSEELQEAIDQGVSPGDHANKQEVALVAGMTLDKRSGVITSVISRDEDGKVKMEDREEFLLLSPDSILQDSAVINQSDLLMSLITGYAQGVMLSEEGYAGG